MTDRYAVRIMAPGAAPGACECYNMETGEAVLSNVTHSRAWREADKRNDEAKSRAEDTNGWQWRKRISE